MTVVTYGHWRAGLDGYPITLRGIIEARQPTSMCDVGGGASAALTADEVSAYGMSYTLLDISREELAKSPDVYRKVVADIAAPNLPAQLEARFDLIQSQMLAEHVSDPKRFHENVYGLLKPGGTAIHLMPTLWEPAFIINRILPERVAQRILKSLQPSRRLNEDQGKFPAYYRWCRGPSRKQIQRFESIGFEVVEFQATFGTGYASNVPGIGRLLEFFARLLQKHPIPALTSYAILVLRKPVSTGT